MNYWVNARIRRKFQFISNRRNVLKNCIWPIELWSQLLISFLFQGWLLLRMQMKKNHINNLKSALIRVLTDLLFHSVFGHVKSVLQNVKNLILVLKIRVNFLNSWTIGGAWKDYWWCLTINCFIWSHFRCSIVGSIIPPSSERYPLFPLMLLFRGETTKIKFQTFVDDFSLTIYLWVINWTHIQFGANEVK